MSLAQGQTGAGPMGRRATGARSLPGAGQGRGHGGGLPQRGTRATAGGGGASGERRAGRRKWSRGKVAEATAVAGEHGMEGRVRHGGAWGGAGAR